MVKDDLNMREVKVWFLNTIKVKEPLSKEGGQGGGADGGEGWGEGGGICKQTIAYHPQYNGEACGCSVHVHVGLCTRRFVHNPMGLSQRHHFKGLTLLDLKPRTQSDYTVLFGKYLGRHFWSNNFLGAYFFNYR